MLRAVRLAMMFVFCIGAAIEGAHAQGAAGADAGAALGPEVTVAKFAIGQILSMGYDTNCKSGATDAGAKLFCSAAGSVTGKDEEEFRQKVTQALGEIDARLGEIDQSLEALKTQETAILLKLSKVNLHLDELVASTNLGAQMITIRAAYEDDFLQLIAQDGLSGPDALEKQTRFAAQIIDEFKIDASLGFLNQALITPADRYDNLIEQWFSEFLVEIDPDKGSVMEAYGRMENLMNQMRIVQAQGEMMYVWAAGIREANCQVNADKCIRPPHTAKEFSAIMAQHYRDQDDAFTRAVVRLAISSVRVHGNDPNFLIPDGPALIDRLHAFEASWSTDSAGLYGMAIGLGGSFDGSLKIKATGSDGRPAERTIAPTGKILAIDTSPTDWWKQRDGQSIYDELHFANTWKVFRYEIKDVGAGPVSLISPVPWASTGTGVSAVVSTHDRNQTVSFGSFLALARAGGAFAMMTGAWPTSGLTQHCQLSLESRRLQTCGTQAGTTSAPAVFFKWNGSFYQSGPTRPMDAGGQLDITLARARPIVYPDGGKVKVVADLGNLFEYTDPNIFLSDERSSAVVTEAWTNFARPVFTNYTANASLRAGIIFGSWQNGHSWGSELNQPPMSDYSRSMHDGRETFTVSIPTNAATPVTLSISGSIRMPTSGMFATTAFNVRAGLSVQSMYLMPN